MSSGFTVLNDNNEVLVSSDTKNLHFAGKATKPSTPLNTFTNHGGFVELVYTITLSNRTSIPVPFFTMPDTSKYYSIAGIKGVDSGSSDKTWSITILRTGGSTAAADMPEVYVFVDPTSVTTAGGTGLQVFNSDGSISFNSRALPLAITQTVLVKPPSNPVNASNFTTLTSAQCGSINNNNFAPTEYNSFPTGPMTTVPKPTKPIYHYNALPQTQREAVFYSYTESCTGFSAYGFCVGYESSLANTSTYWAFYRGGIGNIDEHTYYTVVRAGWVPVIAGCHWASTSDGDFLILFGPGSSNSAGGAWPYSDETINLTLQPVIVADGSRYD
jgi:hypothetical protein